MADVSCVIVGHRESHTIYVTILSVIRAVSHAREFGLDVEINLILDRPDEETKEIASRTLEGLGTVHLVDYGDLAHSRNYATSQCQSRFLAFIDGDDLWCKTWILDAYSYALEHPSNRVYHPEFNIYFGADDSHVLHHVDMEDSDFELEAIYRSNYWTALSFAEQGIYAQYPYRKNTITDGFGYEDWTWNFQTISNNIIHKTVPGTTHFIRRSGDGSSLLAYTNSQLAIPRILDLYTQGLESDTVAKAA